MNESKHTGKLLPNPYKNVRQEYQYLTKQPFFTGKNGFLFLYGKSGQESAQLMRVYLFDLALISRPLKASVFDVLIIQHESCFVPVKSLEMIGTCSAKQKNRIIIGVQTERLGNKSSQSVYPFAKIGLTANEIDFHIIYIWKHFDHDTKDSCSNF